MIWYIYHDTSYKLYEVVYLSEILEMMYEVRQATRSVHLLTR